jgi:hypothetical protein
MKTTRELLLLKYLMKKFALPVREEKGYNISPQRVMRK